MSCTRTALATITLPGELLASTELVEYRHDSGTVHTAAITDLHRPTRLEAKVIGDEDNPAFVTIEAERVNGERSQRVQVFLQDPAAIRALGEQLIAAAEAMMPAEVR